jgi:predicted transcriptional regulator
MRTTKDTIRSQATVGETFEKTRSRDFHGCVVVDDRGVAGVINRARIREALAKGEESKPLQDLLDARDFPHVHADHPLHVALERMGAAKLDVLPVVSRANIHFLVGIVVLPDVLHAFGVEQRELGDHSP